MGRIASAARLQSTTTARDLVPPQSIHHPVVASFVPKEERSNWAAVKELNLNPHNMGILENRGFPLYSILVHVP